jgi:hypothetical protein
LLQKTCSPVNWVLTSPFDICDDLLYLWTDTSNLIVMNEWMNIITTKLYNYNNLVFAYLIAAIYANEPVPSFCQQGYGTSLLAFVAFYIVLYTCISLRFRSWLSVSLVKTRPKLTADAWVRTWVNLCEIHGVWSGIRNTWSLNFFSFSLLFIIPSLILIHLPLLPEAATGRSRQNIIISSMLKLGISSQTHHYAGHRERKTMSLHCYIHFDTHKFNKWKEVLNLQ